MNTNQQPKFCRTWKGESERYLNVARLKSIAAIMLLYSQSGYADDSFDVHSHLSGEWLGARDKLAEQGVDVRLGYFSQTAHNLKGGESTETAYADQFFAGGYFNLEKLLNWSGAEFKVELTNRNGELINEKANLPVLLQSQQIYGRGNVTRLTQFSLTQHLFEDQLSIKVGRIYPSADFFAMSCAFQHLTFCSGGSSNYLSSSWYGDPLSALGVQLTYKVTDNLLFKLGSYDANPATMSLNQGLKLTTSGEVKGTTLVGELEYKRQYKNGLDGDYRFGVVRSSLDKTKLVNNAGYPAGTTSDMVAIEDTDNAFYFNIEQQLTRNSSGGGLRIFASMIHADQSVSAIGEVLAFGGYIDAPFVSRPHDRIGFAVGRNSVSNELSDAQRFYNTNFSDDEVLVRDHEYPIELNYNYVATPAIQLMPSIQYIIDPNGDNDAENAMIAGLQLSLNF
ncbi:carbohydrate porin [Pseudoalteromonas sp. bablab_jr010]|uniref:carbohydrate porin n=1 Tax=Pseudoalteromonas sp. bablab_jr010 TaxID=2755063 RepID=UPI0018F2E178|nr:carbohydrate porin [Pseudoalteromonas sp. bablab_jr010]